MAKWNNGGHRFEMKRNITNEAVKRLKVDARPYEIRDAGLKGLLLRVQPSGVMTYYLEYARGKRLSLGSALVITPYEARELARKELKIVYGGEDPVEKKQKEKAGDYLQFLEKVYKPWLEQNLATAQATYDSLTKAFPELHKLKLAEITPGVIEKWRTRRLKEGIKPGSINRQLDDLRACLNRAKDTWGLIDSNPMNKVKPCKIDTNPKVRYLTDDEEKRLLQALDTREARIRAERNSANQWREERGEALYSDFSDCYFADHLKPAVILSLHTGLRRGELFKLTWDNVDFEQRILTVVGKSSKTGKTRHVPLNAEALKVLTQWKQQPGMKSRYVFPGEDGKPLHDMNTSWGNILGKEQSNIHNFRWHDMRHHFASKLVMAGVDLNTVRELLGHSDYKMTLRYAHLAPEHKQAAVDKLVTIA